MELGISAPGWLADGRCYHPSFPPRSLKLVQDFADFRGTVTTWPSLGGGGISLPYLEQEAYARQPLRMRQYGFLNDKEFAAECQARGIKAFGVIFCTQGWEFPVELNAAEDEVLAMNELRGVGKKGWLGLREFTQSRYPKIWEPFEKYFPNGMFNSRGTPVNDLFEECCSRDIHGNAIHADWLEVPDRDHLCHFMNINNPVWREYLKAVIRVQIDAGVDGVQFDEPDSPFSALKYGGDFSYDVLQPFKEFLQHLPWESVPVTARAQLDGFDYGKWLLERGKERIDVAAEGEEGWFARSYVSFLRGRLGVNFRELASYVREYAASKGRTVLFSANLFDGTGWNEALATEVDILVPEQRYTLFSQPGWMRYMAAFGGDKPVCINPNPYGVSVLPDLVPNMKMGRSLDRYRVMLYEAAALGVNISVSCGSWMGSKIQDAMWSPHDATVEVQDFIANHDECFNRDTFNSTAVVCSVDSNFFETVCEFYARDTEGDEERDEKGIYATPFQQAAQTIASSGRPMDVIIFHDGVHQPDDVSARTLARYQRVVIPGVYSLTPNQVESVFGYLGNGGHVTLVGDFGTHSEDPKIGSIVDHPHTMRVTSLGDADKLAPEPYQVSGLAGLRVSSNIQRLADKRAALHLVNYDYDEAAAGTRSTQELAIAVDIPFTARRVTVHTPGHEPYSPELSGRAFKLRALKCYAIIEVSGE